MDILHNLNINVDGGIKYDFAHVLYLASDFITDMINKNSVALLNGALALVAGNRAENMAYMEANIQLVKNKLGLNKLIYNLQSATTAAGNPSILVEKLDRAKVFCDIIANFILLIIHNLYWIKITDAAGNRICEKSSIPLSNCFDFAIKMGKEMTNMFEKRLDEEYDIASALEEQFGPKATKKKLNK